MSDCINDMPTPISHSPQISIDRADRGATLTVSAFVGQDGATVVQIDTDEAAGHIRINLNDGPPVFDGDPDTDEPPVGKLRQELSQLTQPWSQVAARWEVDGHPDVAELIRAMLANLECSIANNAANRQGQS